MGAVLQVRVLPDAGVIRLMGRGGYRRALADWRIRIGRA